MEVVCQDKKEKKEKKDKKVRMCGYGVLRNSFSEVVFRNLCRRRRTRTPE